MGHAGTITITSLSELTFALTFIQCIQYDEQAQQGQQLGGKRKTGQASSVSSGGVSWSEPREASCYMSGVMQVGVCG